MQFEGGLFPLFMKKMIPKNQLFFLYIIKFVAAQPLVIEVERFTFNFQSIQYTYVCNMVLGKKMEIYILFPKVILI